SSVIDSPESASSCSLAGGLVAGAFSSASFSACSSASFSSCSSASFSACSSASFSAFSSASFFAFFSNSFSACSSSSFFVNSLLFHIILLFRVQPAHLLHIHFILLFLFQHDLLPLC